MDVMNTDTVGGRLHISVEVLAKIAKQAALEVDGVQEVSAANTGVKGLLGKVNPQKPVTVELSDDVAEITVCLIVRYGYKIPSLCEKVQKNVKGSIQNMTNITVAHVNVTVCGVQMPNPEVN